jgi:hypothetical protein
LKKNELLSITTKLNVDITTHNIILSKKTLSKEIYYEEQTNLATKGKSSSAITEKGTIISLYGTLYL